MTPPPPCIVCDCPLDDGRWYFELHDGPACLGCTERGDRYDEVEPGHCAVLTSRNAAKSTETAETASPVHRTTPTTKE